MKTVIIDVPENDLDLFNSLLKKFKFKSRTLSDEEKEEMATAKWINEGMKSEEVSEETVFATLKKHGVKI